MKRGLKGIETKNKLLTVATHEFATMGFNDTKVDTIVRGVNLTKPAFYLYFDSKQAIFDELVDECTRKLKSEVSKIGLTHLDKNELSSERIRNVMENLFQVLLENKEIMIIGILLNRNSDKIINELTDIVKENLRIEATISYIKPVFDDDIFADILVTNVLMLSKNYLLTGKASPKEIAIILSSLFI